MAVSTCQTFVKKKKTRHFGKRNRNVINLLHAFLKFYSLFSRSEVTVNIVDISIKHNDTINKNVLTLVRS